MLTKIAKTKQLVPPFALFHKVPVMIDKTLTKRNTIITNAGSYTDSLQLKAAELVKAGGRVIASFERNNNVMYQVKLEQFEGRWIFF